MTAATHAGAATAPAGLDRGRATRRTRSVLAWLVVVVVGGGLLAVLAGSPPPDDYLHPDGTGQGGTAALVAVLREQGIDVERTATAADTVEAAGDGAGTTVVVGNSDLLTDTAARRVLEGTRGVDRVVLLDAAPGLVGGLGLASRPAAGPAGPADCSSSWVHGDERVDRVSWVLVPTGEDLPAGARGCWPTSGDDDGEDSAPTGYAAVDLPATDRHAELTVVGFPDAATNRFATEADHAALVVRLLGASPHLVWYHPDYEDVTANPSTTDDSAWPDSLGPAVVVAGLAFVAFAVARGRRLGRLVPERLPVVVRAAETTESRAELYRAAADRPRAAAVLRAATTSRLATRLGLPVTARPEQVVPVAADATGTPPEEVERLLRGPVPADDRALVHLAQQLAHLEEKVRTP